MSVRRNRFGYTRDAVVYTRLKTRSEPARLDLESIRRQPERIRKAPSGSLCFLISVGVVVADDESLIVIRELCRDASAQTAHTLVGSIDAFQIRLDRDFGKIIADGVGSILTRVLEPNESGNRRGKGFYILDLFPGREFCRNPIERPIGKIVGMRFGTPAPLQQVDDPEPEFFVVIRIAVETVEESLK
jgi:hypothetical protein